ncbi:MAG: hypothetical protein ABTQ32_12840 [Myxococcaceae bacterium]
MRVVLMPRAMAALRRMVRRWRDTARIPEVFEQDITLALQRIAAAQHQRLLLAAPRVARCTELPQRRRSSISILSSTTRWGVAKVLDVWSQYRSRPPKL